ncbi:MAG: hypothetical protein CGW95_01570, partial [Phenylobacterium zucineum]
MNVKCAHCGAETSEILTKFGEFHLPDCPVSVAMKVGGRLIETLDELFSRTERAEPEPSPNDRAVLLDEAEKLINGQRHEDYGTASENFSRIAHGWSEILGHEVTLVQVALCMDWLKTCRLITSPGHRDSWIDKLGYSA